MKNLVHIVTALIKYAEGQHLTAIAVNARALVRVSESVAKSATFINHLEQGERVAAFDLLRAQVRGSDTSPLHLEKVAEAVAALERDWVTADVGQGSHFDPITDPQDEADGETIPSRPFLVAIVKAPTFLTLKAF